MRLDRVGSNSISRFYTFSRPYTEVAQFLSADEGTSNSSRYVSERAGAHR